MAQFVYGFGNAQIVLLFHIFGMPEPVSDVAGTKLLPEIGGTRSAKALEWLVEFIDSGSATDADKCLICGST